MLARWIYSLVFYLAVPALLYRLHKRAKLNPGYALRKAERFGRYSTSATPALTQCVWIHTVSVGEFIAAQPLIEKLLAEYPHLPMLVTTMTPTGSDRVRAALGERVHHVYLPYDLPGAFQRFLKHFNPKLLVVMETELWPNMIHYTSRRGVPVIIANARLSAKSAQGYKKVLPLVRPMLREVSLVAAQSGPDGERFQDLGLPPASLQVTGTIKFDLNIDANLRAQAQTLREQWGKARPVFIAASTHEGEDEQVLEAYKLVHEAFPEALLVLVPRHPERFDAVASLVQQQGWKLARHSQAEPVNEATNVVLGDTMGELLKMLGAADIAFIGGSLEPVGGHNMLESLAMGTPAITGPHVFNFQMVADLLEEMEVLETICTPIGLGDEVVRLLKDESTRQQLAERGLAVVSANRGAMDRLLDLIRHYLPAASSNK